MQLETKDQEEKMQTTGQMQMEQTNFMSIPRILVSYYRTTMTEQEYLLVYRLVTDLRSARIDVTIDEINDFAMQVSLQEIQQCQWVLLIRTTDISGFAQVKARMQTALGLIKPQHPRGVLCVLTSPPGLQTMHSDSTTFVTFDASRDYPRAFAGIVLTLNPGHQNLYGIQRGAAPPPLPTSNTVLDLLYRQLGLDIRGPVATFRAWSKHLASIIAKIRRLSARATTPQPLSKVDQTHSKVQSFSSVRNVLYQYRQFVSIQRKPRIWFIALGILMILCIITTTFLIATSHSTPAQHTASTMPPTPTKLQEIYRRATSGNTVINDPLQDPNGNNWYTYQYRQQTCTFVNGTYHVSALPVPGKSLRSVCVRKATALDNFALQVDMKLIPGSDVGGVVFRAQGDSYYWFSLDSDGHYELVLSPQTSPDKPQVLLDQKGNSDLHLNMQDKQQLTVIVQGCNIYLYVNGQPIYHNANGQQIYNVCDTALKGGQIGFLALGRPHDPPQRTEAIFMNVKAWNL